MENNDAKYQALKALADEKYNDEARQGLASQYKGNIFQNLAAGLGDSINNAYGGRANAMGTVLARNEAAKKDALSGFDQSKANAVRDYLDAKNKAFEENQTGMKMKADEERFLVGEENQAKLQKERLAAQARENSLNRAETRAERQAKEVKEGLTKGQEALDREFAKEYNDFYASGGIKDVEKGLSQLRDVSKGLMQGNVTGPVAGAIPDFVNKVINPKAISLRDNVEEVVQRNLRLILGAQFTEQEGKRLIARAYNPSLSEAENKKRVDRLIKQIEGAAQAKLSAARHFEETGTLKGWKGTLATSVDDFNLEDGEDGFKNTSDNKEKINNQNNENRTKMVDKNGDVQWVLPEDVQAAVKDGYMAEGNKEDIARINNSAKRGKFAGRF